MRHTFHKSERLCSRKVIEDLFAGGAASFASFPLRAVFKTADIDGVQVLMSVSKRRLRHAVDRNRAKRQMREAYRLNKGILDIGVGSGLEVDGQDQGLSREQGGDSRRGLAVAFVWLAGELADSGRVHRSMRTLLHRIAETWRGMQQTDC